MAHGNLVPDNRRHSGRHMNRNVILDIRAATHANRRQVASQHGIVEHGGIIAHGNLAHEARPVGNKNTVPEFRALTIQFYNSSPAPNV